MQFVVFHLGVAAAIVLMFSISFYFIRDPLPAWLALGFRVIIGAAFLVGVMRIVRRMGNKYMRAISSPDDYFSLWLLTVWFGFAFLAVPNNTAAGHGHRTRSS